MKFWKKPTDCHIVYEALSALADSRIETGDTSAKCFSTSGNKFYTINFDLEKMKFMSNDNMAYYKEEISYPMLAVLLLKKKILFNEEIIPYFKNVPWKDINQKNKNNYMKSVDDFLGKFNYGTRSEIEKETNRIYEELLKNKILTLGEKVTPPHAY